MLAFHRGESPDHARLVLAPLPVRTKTTRRTSPASADASEAVTVVASSAVVAQISVHGSSPQRPRQPTRRLRAVRAVVLEPQVSQRPGAVSRAAKARASRRVGLRDAVYRAPPEDD